MLTTASNTTPPRFDLRAGRRTRSASATRFTLWTRVRGSDGGVRCGDVILTADLRGGRLALVVADTIGCGTPRSERAAAFAADLVGMLSLGASPATAMTFADEELQRAGLEGDLPPLTSAFAGVADPLKQTLSYVSAAHETALLLTPAGTHSHLMCTGPVAGLFERSCFSEAEVPFKRGETLVVVTDGIPDSHIAGGPFFGTTGTVRTATTALRRGDDPAESLIAHAMWPSATANDAAALVVRHNAAT